MFSPCSASNPAGATDLTRIPGLRQLWEQTQGDRRICVAVLDGPIDRSHPSFAGAALSELRKQVPGASTQGLATRHGSHIASVIFGQHNGPIRGIAPRCRGLIVPIFRDVTGGAFTACSQRDLSLAITQAAHAGAHIINISGGALAPSDATEIDPLLTAAVHYCAANRVLIVAAAGNEGCDCLHIPGALPSVLVVGAMSSQGLPLASSNWGENYQIQGVLAPGENIAGAEPAGGISTGTGTSYATPIVSGIAALLLSLQLKRGQKPDPQGVREAILSSALGCDNKKAPDCRRLLVGRLNVGEAMSQIMYGEAAMSKSIEPEDDARLLIQGDMNHEISSLESQIREVQAARATNNGADAAGAIAQPMVPGGAGKDYGRSDGMNKYTSDPVSLSTATCGSGCEDSGPAQLVFVLGKLGYDIVTQGRLDSIQQSMMHYMGVSKSDPNNPNDFAEYLVKRPWDAEAVCWTLLNPEGKPIYAIAPQGAFASETYHWLRETLEKQLKKTEDPASPEIERVSVAGRIAGSARLFSCNTVDVICPDLRGMYRWKTDKVLEKLLPTNEQARENLREFLNYLYEEQCNLGITPVDRALNFAATNARALAEVFLEAEERGLEFYTFHVEPSQSCYQDTDRLNIKLLFNEKNRTDGIFPTEHKPLSATPQFFITVGVGDAVPVTLGEVRSWFVPSPPKQAAPETKC